MLGSEQQAAASSSLHPVVITQTAVSASSTDMDETETNERARRAKLERCGERWGVTSIYEDYKEMLREETLDIMSICTWNSTHLEIVREALKSGVKAVFCEKPIADSLSNADKMISLCNERGVILQVDHQRRFDGLHGEIRDFLQSGKLGRIQQVTFYYTSGIANTGSHMFDLLRFFFGDVEWVQAFYSQNKSSNSFDPNIDGIVKFKNGLFCAYFSLP